VSGPYREQSVPRAAEEEPAEAAWRWRCLSCWRTDCAVHAERNAADLGRCNHDNDSDSRTPRVPCAHCGAGTVQ